MEVVLQSVDKTSHVVEIGSNWQVEDLRKAAAVAIEGEVDVLLLVISGVEYGKSENGVMLADLGVIQGETIEIRYDKKQAALSRLAASEICATYYSLLCAVQCGNTQQALDLIEVGVKRYQEDTPVLLAVRLHRSNVALAILCEFAETHRYFFTPGVLGLAIKQGNVSIMECFFSRGLYQLPKRFNPYTQACTCRGASEPWESIYSLLMEHKVLHGKHSAVVNTINELAYPDYTQKLRVFLAGFEHSVPLQCLTHALLVDPIAAELILDHGVELKTFRSVSDLLGTHHHLAGKVAKVIRGIHKGFGIPAKRLNRCMQLAATVEELSALVEAGGDPYVGLCHCKDVVTARWLIESCHVAVRCSAPLLNACHVGCLGLVQLLVRHGADVNALGEGGSSPTIAACRHGWLDVVRYLVEECGANHLHRTPAGFNAASAAAASGHLDIVQYLVNHNVSDAAPLPNGMNLVHINARAGICFLPVELCTLTGSHLLDTDNLGRDVFMYAGIGAAEVTKELVNQCLVDRKCKKGWTALGYALLTGKTCYISLLLDAERSYTIDTAFPHPHDCSENVISAFLKRKEWDARLYTRLKACGAQLHGMHTLRAIVENRKACKDAVLTVFADVQPTLSDDECIGFYHELAASHPAILFCIFQTHPNLFPLFPTLEKLNGRSFWKVLAENKEASASVIRNFVALATEKDKRALFKQDSDGVSVFRTLLNAGILVGTTDCSGEVVEEIHEFLQSGGRLSERVSASLIDSKLFNQLNEDDQLLVLRANFHVGFFNVSNVARHVADQALAEAVSSGRTQAVLSLVKSCKPRPVFAGSVMLPVVNKRNKKIWVGLSQVVTDRKAYLARVVEYYEGVSPRSAKYYKRLRDNTS